MFPFRNPEVRQYKLIYVCWPESCIRIPHCRSTQGSPEEIAILTAYIELFVIFTALVMDAVFCQRHWVVTTPVLTFKKLEQTNPHGAASFLDGTIREIGRTNARYFPGYISDTADFCTHVFNALTSLFDDVCYWGDRQSRCMLQLKEHRTLMFEHKFEQQDLNKIQKAL